MAKALDPYVKKILKEFLPNDIDPMSAVWIHKQSDSYIVTHKSLEIVAAKAGILFEPPVIVQHSAEDKICILIATGKLAERVEWSFGEATPYNNHMSYPYAMAEKRAKDRVILKLMGIHGYIYTDAEMEDAEAANNMMTDKKSKKEVMQEAEKNSSGKPDYHDILAGLEAKFQNCTTEKEVKDVWGSNKNNLKWMKEYDVSLYDVAVTAKDVAKERVSVKA